MRGCLWTCLAAAAALLGLAWVGLPALAAAVVRAGLAADGFTAARLEVAVSASPPLRLLLLQANAVTVDAVNLRGPALMAGTVHLRLEEVDLGRRAVGRLEGTILAAQLLGLGPGGGALPVAEVELSGSGARPVAVLWETADEVGRLVEGAAPAGARLVGIRPPADVILGVDGSTVTGRLVIADGQLIFTLPGRQGVTVAAPDPGVVGLESVAVVDGRLRVGARLAPRLLGLPG